MAVPSYFREAREELKKTVWPTRQETVNGTVMVIAISLFVALFLGAADFVLTLLFEQVLQRF